MFRLFVSFAIVSLVIISCVAASELPQGAYSLSAFEQKMMRFSSSGAQRFSDDYPGGYNETYGYPDGIGGLIIEGSFAYENGPDVWSEENPWGAYGMIFAAADYDKEAKECAAVPDDSPFAGSKDVVPGKLKELGTCGLTCNLDDVKNTGVDPCHAGNLGAPLSNSPMSCFDIGNMLKDKGPLGVCAYNCTAFFPDDMSVPCTGDNLIECTIYCDSRTFPVPSSAMV